AYTISPQRRVVASYFDYNGELHITKANSQGLYPADNTDYSYDALSQWADSQTSDDRHDVATEYEYDFRGNLTRSSIWGTSGEGLVTEYITQYQYDQRG